MKTAKIGEAGFKEKIRNTGQLITSNPTKRKPMEKIHLKFIDDMTAAVSINLKQNLVQNPDPNPIRPLQYHDRTQHILPEERYQLQSLLDDLMTYSDDHQMQINQSKSKVMLFNNAIKYDFLPKLSLQNDNPLEVVEEMRLLGVVVRSDLSWRSNTTAMCQKAYARLWMLRRLKPLGASVDELLDVYEKQIRCITEFSVAVWTSGITKDEVNQIERVQKAAFAIILAEKYKSYDNALIKLNRTTLSYRRKELNLKFANKCIKSEKYEHWFCINNPSDQISKTRSEQTELIPVQARTSSSANSPIAYLTRLINESKSK